MKVPTRFGSVLVLVLTLAATGCGGGGATTTPRPVASPGAAPENPQNGVNQKAKQQANEQNAQIP